ncbi:MAG: LON peptidase substrate-binding domain-containing protein [Verrucomicrobia bacterium]|nr:LON peptidase substrate-binding domain-containing protein [Verrucomicrobiota bacterium]
MELPPQVPVMTLPSATLFPQALLPLYIFEPRYRQMLRDALDTHRMFTVAMQKPDRVREAPCAVAGLGLIRVSVRHSDGTSHLILQGLTRVELTETIQAKPYRVHRMHALATPPAEVVAVDALVAKVLELVARCLHTGAFASPFPLSSVTEGQSKKLGGKPPAFSVKEVLRYLEGLRSPEVVADLVSCALLSNPLERQSILETVELHPRLGKLIHFLMAQLAQHGHE